MESQIRIDKFLICPICNNHSQNPVYCVHCGVACCKHCVTDFFNNYKLQNCKNCSYPSNFVLQNKNQNLTNYPFTGKPKKSLKCCLCKFEISDEKEFISHILLNHPKEIINQFDLNSKVKSKNIFATNINKITVPSTQPKPIEELKISKILFPEI